MKRIADRADGVLSNGRLVRGLYKRDDWQDGERLKRLNIDRKRKRAREQARRLRDTL